MKKVAYTIHKVLFVILCACAMAACTEKNDWDTDSSHARLWGITDLELTPAAIEAEIEWSTLSKPEYYIIEVSTSELTDDMELGESEGSVIYGEDKSITSSPTTISNLLGSTTYYFRIKGFTSEKETKWAYDSFTTNAEQIITRIVTDENSATIKWGAGLKATSIVIKTAADDAQVLTYTVTSQDIANGEAVITGLSAATSYIAYIYNGTVLRGEKEFDTEGAAEPEIPEGYTTTTLGLGDDLETVLSGLSGNVGVILPQGGSYTLTSSGPVKLPAAITGLVIVGEEGDNLPVLTTRGMGFEAGAVVELVKLQRLNIQDFATQTNYAININTAITCERVVIRECVVEDVRGVVRVQDASAVVKNIEIDDCVINNIGSYGIVTATVAITVENITLNESTINGLSSRAFDFNNMLSASVVVESCTFYNAPGGDFMRVTSGNSVYLTVANSVFGKFYASAVKGCNQSGYITSDRSYYTTDNVWSSNAIGSAYEGAATDLFTDPANGDFSFKDAEFAEKYCGDPRWWID